MKENTMSYERAHFAAADVQGCVRSITTQGADVTWLGGVGAHAGASHRASSQARSP
jgi:hypothetical protein